MAQEKKPPSPMAHIPPPSLLDLPSRISYLSSFLSFQPSDGLAIQSSKPLIAPLIPVALDLVYSKLLSFDITAKAFVPRQGGGSENGPVPSRPQDLHLTHSHILHRKDFLKAYLVRIVSNADWSPKSPLWHYMDLVGAAHAGGPLLRHRQQRRIPQNPAPALRVEYMHLGLLLGFVEEVIVGLVLDMNDIDSRTKRDVILAWNKILWIQNDLFARHYVVDKDTGEWPAGFEKNGNGGLMANTWGVGMFGLVLGAVAVRAVGGFF